MKRKLKSSVFLLPVLHVLPDDGPVWHKYIGGIKLTVVLD
jgi:hypothetical protein